jgi:excisionase family DNA binding protein
MHTVRKLVRDGALPAARIGRSYRFKADDIDSWIREQYHFMYPNKEKETQAKEAEAF